MAWHGNHIRAAGRGIQRDCPLHVPLVERGFERGEVFPHHVEVARLRGRFAADGLERVERDDALVTVFRGAAHGLGDLVPRSFEYENRRQLKLVDLLREEDDGLETGLALGGAAGERGEVFETVVVRDAFSTAESQY